MQPNTLNIRPTAGDTYITVTDCQRCGKNHMGLLFKKLANPADEWSYWAMCPTTQQPVLMRVVEGQEVCDGK